MSAHYLCLSMGVLNTGTPVAGGRAALPLTISAAFSANIIVGAFRLPDTILGRRKMQAALQVESQSHHLLAKASALGTGLGTHSPHH